MKPSEAIPGAFSIGDTTMLNLPDRASQLSVLDQPLEPNLHSLIKGRVQDAAALGLADLTHIVVVEPYDTEADLIEALGFSPLVSRLDGTPLQPDWDWIECHPGWWELVYTVSNDGFAFLVLVKDSPEVLPNLLALCRAATATSET